MRKWDEVGGNGCDDALDFEPETCPVCSGRLVEDEAEVVWCGDCGGQWLEYGEALLPVAGDLARQLVHTVRRAASRGRGRERMRVSGAGLRRAQGIIQERALEAERRARERVEGG